MPWKTEQENEKKKKKKKSRIHPKNNKKKCQLTSSEVPIMMTRSVCSMSFK